MCTSKVTSSANIRIMSHFVSGYFFFFSAMFAIFFLMEFWLISPFLMKKTRKKNWRQPRNWLSTLSKFLNWNNKLSIIKVQLGATEATGVNKTWVSTAKSMYANWIQKERHAKWWKWIQHTQKQVNEKLMNYAKIKVYRTTDICLILTWHRCFHLCSFASSLLNSL